MHLRHKDVNKKGKFPNYLHHVQTEDDSLATCTLFAGNLEINITEKNCVEHLAGMEL